MHFLLFILLLVLISQWVYIIITKVLFQIILSFKSDLIQIYFWNHLDFDLIKYWVGPTLIKMPNLIWTYTDIYCFKICIICNCILVYFMIQSNISVNESLPIASIFNLKKNSAFNKKLDFLFCK